jgi:hypothetical protein
MKTLVLLAILAAPLAAQKPMAVQKSVPDRRGLPSVPGTRDGTKWKPLTPDDSLQIRRAAAQYLDRAVSLAATRFRLKGDTAWVPVLTVNPRWTEVRVEKHGAALWSGVSADYPGTKDTTKTR